MSEQWVLYRDGVPWGYYDSQSEGRAELMEHVRADEDAEWRLEDANISSTQDACLTEEQRIELQEERARTAGTSPSRTAHEMILRSPFGGSG